MIRVDNKTKPNQYFPSFLLSDQRHWAGGSSVPTHPYWWRTDTGEQETRRQCAIKAAARCWINDNICMRVWATIEAVTMGTGAKASGGKEQTMMKGGKVGEGIFRLLRRNATQWHHPISLFALVLYNTLWCLPQAVKRENVTMDVNYKYCGETWAWELLGITIL